MLVKREFTIEVTFNKPGNLEPLDEDIVKNLMGEALHRAQKDVIISKVTSTTTEPVS